MPKQPGGALYFIDDGASHASSKPTGSYVAASRVIALSSVGYSISALAKSRGSVFLIVGKLRNQPRLACLIWRRYFVA
jgi:hypothetical protein